MREFTTMDVMYDRAGCLSEERVSPVLHEQSRTTMRRYKDTYRIETTRLSGYDYASAGWYHVVICTKDRARVFGTVRGGIMGLSRVGAVAHRFCAAIPDHSDRAVVDAFVVMPNHVHAIVGIRSPNDDRRDVRSRVSTGSRVSTTENENPSGAKANAFGPLEPGALPTIVHSYKGAVTRWAHRNGCDGFAWQPRYWDRIIRDDRELRRTRRYIDRNPLTWRQDDLF